MSYNYNSHLWTNKDEAFFRDAKLSPMQQKGPHCVSTSLAILTGAKPEDFQGIVNTQNPMSWSDNIKKWGMQLSYCPTDARKLGFYIEELIDLDDLFTLSYYTPLSSDLILSDPNSNGWICGSHIIILHRDKIFDPAQGNITSALEHHCNEYHTKRVFRVVPADYHRGL